MNIPLDTLIDKETNRYELTCVAIKQAEYLTRDGDESFELQDQKVVSIVLKDVLENKVEYKKIKK